MRVAKIIVRISTATNRMIPRMSSLGDLKEKKRPLKLYDIP